MKKKKGRRKKNLPPRAKRMKRPGRLESAKTWIPKFRGTSIVRGYVKHYGVDHRCAVKELQMLGVEVDPAYVERVETTARTRTEAGRRRKERGREAEKLEQLADLGWNEDGGCNDEFAYIAGFTSGGAPYGVTWEEMGEKPPWAKDDEDPIPF